MASAEIGGYFELERFPGSPYHQEALALNSGRAALGLLIAARGIERVVMPRFLCDSVPLYCERSGARVGWYDVDASLAPAWESISLNPGDWLYLVDYYGQLTEPVVDKALAVSEGRLVVDEVQSFFRMPRPGVDTLYTARKFFGVADGSYLYADGDAALLAASLPQDQSHDRMKHLLGRFELPASDFYGSYQQNEETFYDEPPKRMSSLTANILRGTDYELARLRREENWARLHDALGPLNGLSLQESAGPFAYPLLLEEGPAVRGALIKERIYVPTLWPNVLEEVEEGSIQWRLASNILPLPVDQRYGAAEMDKIVRCVKSALPGGN